jgi:hypothetical protein
MVTMNCVKDRREYSVDEIEDTMIYYGFIHIEQAIIKLDQLTDQPEQEAGSYNVAPTTHS